MIQESTGLFFNDLQFNCVTYINGTLNTTRNEFNGGSAVHPQYLLPTDYNYGVLLLCLYYTHSFRLH